MGEGAEWIAARGGYDENDRLSDCKAHHVGIRPQKDRRRSKSEVGEGQGAAKEGSVKSRRKNRARRMAGLLFDEESVRLGREMS